MASSFGGRRLASSLTLPCGATLANRIAKAALGEGLADPLNAPSEGLLRLYRVWAESGAGLLITGAVQVDRRHVARAGDVVIEAPIARRVRARLRRWAEAATIHGAHLWMQLSHPGRLTPARFNLAPLAPSATPFSASWRRFGAPRAMHEDDITDVVARFAFAAEAARDTGFTGVQIHAAHGVLLGQFLSPRTNTREDAWGGPLENRARLLLAVVQAVRARVGADFPVAVKLNARDPHADGFAFAECRRVAAWLESAGVDLMEVSGGDLERPAMLAPAGGGAGAFAQEAASLRGERALAVMATGGWRARSAMDAALAAGGADVIGLARSFCVEPEVAARLLADPDAIAAPAAAGAGRPRALEAAAAFANAAAQLRRLADGGAPDPTLSPAAALVETLRAEAAAARAWRPPGP